MTDFTFMILNTFMFSFNVSIEYHLTFKALKTCLALEITFFQLDFLDIVFEIWISRGLQLPFTSLHRKRLFLRSWLRNSQM